mmetsp:Transcript_19218/g.41532  ORF Transcript_19218/g.41532 Transcript_19218/m.41532 type:complete len:238 (+) Transcript_19218:458-1171(+)
MHLLSLLVLLGCTAALPLLGLDLLLHVRARPSAAGMTGIRQSRRWAHWCGISGRPLTRSFRVWSSSCLCSRSPPPWLQVPCKVPPDSAWLQRKPWSSCVCWCWGSTPCRSTLPSSTDLSFGAPCCLCSPPQVMSGVQATTFLRSTAHSSCTKACSCTSMPHPWTGGLARVKDLGSSSTCSLACYEVTSMATRMGAVVGECCLPNLRTCLSLSSSRSADGVVVSARTQLHAATLCVQR